MYRKLDSKSARQKLAIRREPYWHKIERGGHLGFRRTHDSGTWVVRFRNAEGKHQYESLGALREYHEAEQFDEAMILARKWLTSLGGMNRVGYTVQDAIDDYVRHREIKNSALSATDARQRLYKHAVPELGGMRLTKLTMQQVSCWRDSLVRLSDDEEDVRKSKDGANRLLSMLKAALNLAYNQDIIGTDKAWRRVKAFSDVTAARKVLLDDEEITRLLAEARGGFKDLVQSAILTGARYGELASARVEDFDARAGTIHLSGKTGPRDVYLSDAAAAHLKALCKNKLPKAHIHLKDDGTPWGRSHQSRPMRELVRAARLPAETTFYALRHTHISRALLVGVNAQVVAENCGTSIRMIEKHYGKFMKADRRAMFNRVRLGTRI